MDIKWLWLRTLPNRAFIWRGRLHSRKTASTFDNGPHKDTTHEILDILKRYKVKATFFLSGSQIEENADVLERMYTEGHEIGNHSYDHIALHALSLKEITVCSISE